MNDISVLPSGSTLLVEIVLQYIGTAALHPRGNIGLICPQLLGHHAAQFSPCSLFLPLLHWPSLRGFHALLDLPLPPLF